MIHYGSVSYPIQVGVIAEYEVLFERLAEECPGGRVPAVRLEKDSCPYKNRVANFKHRYLQ